MALSSRPYPEQVTFKVGDELLPINAQPQGLMSMAGGQAQMDAVNDANGVFRESPHVPPAM